MAACKPELIIDLFHKKSRVYQQNGTYVVKFYKQRQMQVVCIDDFFPSINVIYIN